MSSVQRPGYVECPNCGNINPAHFRTCANCGRLLPRQTYTPGPTSLQQEERAPRKGRKFYASARRFGLTTLLLVSLLMLILGAVIGYLLAITPGA